MLLRYVWQNAVSLATPVDIALDSDCVDGYFDVDNVCVPAGSRYDGCGSVSLNHLWNGHSFLTVSSDNPVSSARARNVLSIHVAVCSSTLLSQTAYAWRASEGRRMRRTMRLLYRSVLTSCVTGANAMV